MTDWCDQLASCIGAEKLLRPESSSLSRYLKESRGHYQSQAAAVALPTTTEQVVTIVQVCAQHGVSIVGQGGNTSHCGGAVATRQQLIVSFQDMNQIRSIDPTNYAMTVDAGCILQDVQNTALEHDRMYPLSFGAEASCRIGGCLSTNAGGMNVLRYGNARDTVLGLEVVLADGTVLNELNSLRKNNTGYDLKQLFIGSEGTLGLITGACLKLYPAPKASTAALIALPDLDAVLHCYQTLQSHCTQTLTSFELIPQLALRLIERHFPNVAQPLASKLAPWFVYVQAQTSSPQHDIEANLLEGLSALQKRTQLLGTAIGQSAQQQAQLLSIRESLVLAQKHHGHSIKHDISVPISAIPELIQRGNAALSAISANAQPYPFGHIGDGNIHYNVCLPKSISCDELSTIRLKINDAIYGLVDELGGSFSAEHGIGLLKKPEMSQYKQPASLNVMRLIKQALDPNQLFNPGKVLPD